MKTKELANMIISLGYKQEIKGDFIVAYVMVDYRGSTNRKKIIAQAHLKERYHMRTYEGVTFPLYTAFAQFAQTSIPEREPISKMYRIRITEKEFDDFDRFLNYDGQKYFFAGEEEFGLYKTKFREEDIKYLPEWVRKSINDGYLEKIETK